MVPSGVSVQEVMPDLYITPMNHTLLFFFFFFFSFSLFYFFSFFVPCFFFPFFKVVYGDML